MTLRFLKSRGATKFRRNKMAMAASGVILLYFLVALIVMFGAITLEETTERVLPKRTYGFLQRPDLEDRFNTLTWYISQHLSRPFSRPGGIAEATNPQSVLDPVALAERRVADLPLEQLDQMWGELSSQYEELDEKWLLREDLGYEVEDIEIVLSDETDPEERASLEADLDEAQAELTQLNSDFIAQLKTVETRLREFMPIPDGWAGVKYRFRTFLGSDDSGRSISIRAFYSIKIAFQIGFVAALVSVLIGTLLGAAAGFFGGWIDHIVMWIVSTLSSVPYLVLLAVLVYMFRGSKLFDNPAEHPAFALVPVYVAFCSTFWISTCRVIRGEVMKIRELEYVQAATSIGFGRFYILLRHVIPNTTHLMFINFSLIFIGAIKSEVILSFLGLGVKGQPSWGIMISLGREDVQVFFFWSVLSATALMFGLVLAFNIVSDALQDAFDPKHVT